MFENKESRTELSSLGEFGLINHLAKNITIINPETIKGIGDDAAVIDLSPNPSPHREGNIDLSPNPSPHGEGNIDLSPNPSPHGEGNSNLQNSQTVAVVTTDMLIEGVHFDLTYCPLKHLGYKSITVNLSDVYAMNAIPKQVTVAIGISNRFSLEAIEELYAGMLLACNHYGVDLVGGDTTTSKSGLVLSITAIGKAQKEDIVYRNGAQDNDLICVTGDLGAAYMGLQLLNREKLVFIENPKIQPEFAGNDYLLERQLKPEARKDLFNTLQQAGVKPTAMIDVSDGLASELLHICTQSNKGCQIYEDKIPIDPKTYDLAREFNLDATVCALNGGEDYELLFTIPITDYEKIKDKADISIIGHITEAGTQCLMLDKSGNSMTLKAQGWDGLK